jgi:hypothetical protein
MNQDVEDACVCRCRTAAGAEMAKALLQGRALDACNVRERQRHLRRVAAAWSRRACEPMVLDLWDTVSALTPTIMRMVTRHDDELWEELTPRQWKSNADAWFPVPCVPGSQLRGAATWGAVLYVVVPYLVMRGGGTTAVTVVTLVRALFDRVMWRVAAEDASAGWLDVLLGVCRVFHGVLTPAQVSHACRLQLRVRSRDVGRVRVFEGSVRTLWHSVFECRAGIMKAFDLPASWAQAGRDTESCVSGTCRLRVVQPRLGRLVQLATFIDAVLGLIQYLVIEQGYAWAVVDNRRRTVVMRDPDVSGGGCAACVHLSMALGISTCHTDFRSCFVSGAACLPGRRCIRLCL